MNLWSRLTTWSLMGSFCWVSYPLFAHPTSFKGAITVESENSSQESNFINHYSFDPHLALGARALRQKEKAKDLFGYESYLGLLAYRKNDERYQANLYVFGGLGAHSYRNKWGLASFAGAQADVEDRRFLMMHRFMADQFSKAEDRYQLLSRVGVAPYVARYDEINSWLIFEYEYNSRMKQQHNFSPIARLFYRNVLLEAGSSFRGDWKFNFMVHF